MDDRPELEQGLDALYVAVRNSAAVDRQAAFDIAMNELEYFPLHAVARELAEASVTDDDEARLASAVRRSWTPTDTSRGSSRRRNGSRGWSGRWTRCGPTCGRPG